MRPQFRVMLKGNRYIIVVVCCFSKFLGIYALTSQEASEIANRLTYEWIGNFGVPKAFLSDRGRSYQSMLMELVYELLDVKQLRTTAYHPQGDGQAERSIRTAKEMLRCFVDENQQNWDDGLSLLALAYNSSVNSTTKQTPFKMWFGRDPRMPSDIAFGPEPEPRIYRREKTEEERDGEKITVLSDDGVRNPKVPIVAKEYLKNLEIKLQSIYKIARHSKNITMSKAQIRHERQVRKFQYNIGDQVLVNHPYFGSKKGLSKG